MPALTTLEYPAHELGRQLRAAVAAGNKDIEIGPRVVELGVETFPGAPGLVISGVDADLSILRCHGARLWDLRLGGEGAAND